MSLRSSVRLTRFRRLLIGGALVALMAVGGSSVSAQSCSGRAPGVGDYGDRSWIQTDAVIFGAGVGQGVFRLRLNSNRPEPIGDHMGASIDDFRMSANHAKLIYSLTNASGDASHWFYDINTGRETELETLTKAIGPWDEVEYSADADKVAWVPRPREGAIVSIMNLQSARVSSYTLPAATTDADTLLFGLAWSRSGNEVLVGRRWGKRGDFWSINPGSGEVRKIEGERITDPTDPTGTSIHYFREGADIGNDCIMCGRPGGSPTVPLAGGAQAVRTLQGDLVVARPGSPMVTVAKAEPDPSFQEPSGETVVSACGGVVIGLIGAFDGRYIVYTRNGAYWVYGVNENRRASLPGLYLVW